MKNERIRNKYLDSIKFFACNPLALVPAMGGKGLLNKMKDETYLRICFRSYVGYGLNLDNPQSFNEKLQWLKLNDRNPLYTTLADKILVKDYVSKNTSLCKIPKTFYIWESPDDISIEKLPDRFVLKTNHDCGGVVVCKDKNSFDLSCARSFLGNHLKRNYYFNSREWPYKDINPKIFAEEFIDINTSDHDLPDYKFLCFDGIVHYIFTCSNRASNDLRVDFYDTSWNLMPFTRHYPNADVQLPKPPMLADMISAAEQLSKGIPFVRVDFYDGANEIIFGEMTFYPGSGFEEFSPIEWDYKLGSLINLDGLGHRQIKENSE